MNETQRSALDALMTGYFQFGLGDLEDSKVDISDALVERAYADTLHGIVEVDPAAGKAAKANVKTLLDEMINNKIDFEKEGLDIWLGCLYREIVKHYQGAGLTEQNPMTEDLSKKWVCAFLENLTIVADVASLDDELKSSYSFDYYQRFVDAFRDCFPPVA